MFDKYLPSSVTLTGSTGPSTTSNFSFAAVGTQLDEAYKKATDAFGDVKTKFAKLTSGGPELKKVLPAAPKDPSATSTAIKQNTIGNTAAPDNTFHKVKLTASVADGESTAIRNDVAFPVEPLMQRQVEFDMMPEISEVRNVDYEALQTPQLPGEFQKYRGTKSTQWTITATFTARTRDEAKRNYIYMNNLRGWTMPYFGENQRKQFGGTAEGARGKLGSPPPVLTFSGWRGLVGPVPVVVTALNWSWPRDCDWLPTGILDTENGQEIPFPSVMNVNITIVEAFSAEQFNGFDLVSFRNGRMVNAWEPLARTDTTSVVAEPVGGNQGITNGVPQPTNPNYSNEGRNYLKPPPSSSTVDRGPQGINIGVFASNPSDGGGEIGANLPSSLPVSP